MDVPIIAQAATEIDTGDTAWMLTRPRSFC